MFARRTYEKRRLALRNNFEDGIILICGNSLSPANYRDNTFPFVQDSTFLYYFGLNKENLIGVIDIDKEQEYIFGNELTMDDIIWSGPQISLGDQCKLVGVENLLPYEDIKRFLYEVKHSGRKIHYINQYLPNNIINIADWLEIKPNEVNDYVSEKLSYAVVEQRNYKTPEEVQEIIKAVNVTREMHLKAMEIAKPGMKEYEVAAALENVAKSKNCTLSFLTICTVNGQTLHNHYHGNTLKEGDLLLIDAGAKTESGYCGDMTTTFPVSGKFTPLQKEFYNLLISMFDKASELIRPGITYKEIHLEVCKVLAKGLVEKNILKGNVDEIVEKGTHALFMPHGLGHMLGLDVHDMENIGEVIVGYNGEAKSTQFGLASLRLGRELEEDFVFTVEPGIYFIPELIKKWKNENKFPEYINYEELEKYMNFGGMRYEGDFLVTKTGNIRLGETMVKSPEEVEEVRAKAFK
ncbi:MAG: aminopeptidase P family protein [Fusobacterium perfoetens]|uniref:aminopeptidase P family protein n=1 Tax=Fusobacterium perfoetens TaxID=852 RepID=UPI0023F241F2|nr:aminopeptidase P family protein [Fusobacterium perfoetens]MCI6153199.1 aminopeptidase P family protein [Fusobacterium perfoetens]MDY3238300.1 aminopeptidase P family protein [Fusobacterium perfoetens]